MVARALRPTSSSRRFMESSSSITTYGKTMLFSWKTNNASGFVKQDVGVQDEVLDLLGAPGLRLRLTRGLGTPYSVVLGFSLIR